MHSVQRQVELKTTQQPASRARQSSFYDSETVYFVILESTLWLKGDRYPVEIKVNNTRSPFDRAMYLFVKVCVLCLFVKLQLSPGRVGPGILYPRLSGKIRVASR